MKVPVLFKPRDPDIPPHLWSSARWGSRTKWFHLTVFIFIEFGIAHFSDLVWGTGAHLLACVMFTVMSLGSVAGTYFWWLHMRPLNGMYRLFDGNIDGRLISLCVPNKLAQKGRKWQKIMEPFKGLSDATTAYYDALLESPENLVPDSRVMESLAAIETALRQKATIRALTSSSVSNDEDGAVYRLNKLIGDTEDLIREETRRVRGATDRDAAMEIEQAIDFAVNGPSNKGTSTTKTGTLTVGDSQGPATMGADTTDEPSAGSDPDILTLWGDNNLRVTTGDNTSYVRKKEEI